MEIKDNQKVKEILNLNVHYVYIQVVTQRTIDRLELFIDEMLTITKDYKTQTGQTECAIKRFGEQPVMDAGAAKEKTDLTEKKW